MAAVTDMRGGYTDEGRVSLLLWKKRIVDWQEEGGGGAISGCRPGGDAFYSLLGVL